MTFNENRVIIDIKETSFCPICLDNLYIENIHTLNYCHHMYNFN